MILPNFVTQEQFREFIKPHNERALLLATLASIEKFAPLMGFDLDRGYTNNVGPMMDVSIRPVIEGLRTWAIEGLDFESMDPESERLPPRSMWRSLSNLAYDWVPENVSARIKKAKYAPRIPQGDSMLYPEGYDYEWYSPSILEDLVNAICGFMSRKPPTLHEAIGRIDTMCQGVRFGEMHQNLRNALCLDILGRLSVPPGMWGPWHQLKAPVVTTEHFWAGDYLWDGVQKKFTTLRHLGTIEKVVMDWALEHNRRLNIRKRAFES